MSSSPITPDTPAERETARRRTGGRTKTTTNGVASIAPGGEMSPPLLIGRDGLAVALSIGTASLDRLDSAGKLPKSIKLGGRKLWNRVLIDQWIALDCPDRKTFETLTAK